MDGRWQITMDPDMRREAEVLRLAYEAEKGGKWTYGAVFADLLRKETKRREPKESR